MGVKLGGVLMKYVLLIVGPFLPVLIFYIFDKLFNLKIKLIKLFKTTGTYKTTIIVISISSYALFCLFLFIKASMHLVNLPFSIILLYYYLIRIPKESQ